MDLAVARVEGDPLDAAAELLVRGHSLVVVAAHDGWERVSLGLEPGHVSRTVVSRQALTMSVVSTDLLFMAEEPSAVAEALAQVDGTVVAVRDGRQWSKPAVAELLMLLQGRPVLFFVHRNTVLGLTVDQETAFVGRVGDDTVVGMPATGREELPILHVGDSLRVADVEARFLTWYQNERPAGYHDEYEPWHEVQGPAAAPAEYDDPDVPPGVRHDARPRARSVNTLVVRHGEDDGLAPAEPLAQATDYDVLLAIGEHLPTSLLTEPEAQWPDEPLPDGDLALRAVLSMAGSPTPQVARFTLPHRSQSFACDCEPDPHDRDCARRPWVRFTITTPAAPTVWSGELVIYYGVVAVHAQQLFLPVGEPTADGMHARLHFRLTRSFADLGALAERSASVLVTDGGSRALVNGVPFADNPAWISANAADNAVRAARQLLYDLHLTAGPDGPVSTLDARHGKSAAEFTEDLARLARQGAVLYDRLFRDNAVFDTLPDLIRHEAAARGRPAVLTVADPTISDPDRQHPVPWSLVYDLPMPQDPHGAFRLCPSLTRFGPDGPGEPVPPHCPEPDHDGNVLCPFGFWGLSSVLEQPASTGGLVWHVLGEPEPESVAVAVDPGLDGPTTDQHLAALAAALPAGAMVRSTVTSPGELAAALAGETMDIAYLYCHGGYYRLAANALPSPVLRWGDSMLDPVEVANWRRDRAVWPRPHWPRRKPLIVLNGCHTAELTTATLSNFVDAFANRAGAAGVIGTEVSVEQGMSSWAMEQLLQLLVDGQSVGQALRTVRWRMISRGNVMGLAYTLYCVAGLRLRPLGGRALIRKDAAP